MRVIDYTDTLPESEPELEEGERLFTVRMHQRTLRYFHIDLEGLSDDRAMVFILSAIPDANYCAPGWLTKDELRERKLGLSA